MDKMSIAYITHPEEMSPDQFFDELDKLFGSDDGYIKHLERIKILKEEEDKLNLPLLNYLTEKLPEVMGKTIKIKEQNECLKTDMRNLEDETWKLKEEAECQAEVIRMLKEEKETNMKTIQKLLSDKKRESKEMSRRLEYLGHFQDYVFDYAEEDFKEYLESCGLKMIDDDNEIVDISDSDDDN